MERNCASSLRYPPWVKATHCPYKNNSGARMPNRYYEKDGNLDYLAGRTVAIIGYGSQALARALAYALALGCLKAGVIDTNFREETESDLFGEQAVLCGGTAELIRAGFQTLVEAGYAPEIAYFECLHELKLIVDLIQEGGLSYMRYSVSDTAEYGDYTRGPRIVNDQTRAEMKKILGEIQSGEFARQWIDENKSGRKKFLAMRQAAQNDQIETVGRELREMMTFLKKKKEVGVPVA